MKVTVTIDVGTLPETGDDWELYTASMDCAEAATALTKALEEAIIACAAGKRASQAMSEHFCPVARTYADWGACDSEPMGRAERFLERVQAMTTLRPVR